MKYIFLFITAFLAIFADVTAQDKLFDYKQYAHRSHAENRLSYIKVCWKINEMDSSQAMRELEKMRKAGIELGDKQMELEALFLTAYLNKKNWSEERRVEELKKVYSAGKQRNILQIQLRTLYWIGKSYENGLNNSAMALEYYIKMKPLLSLVSTEEFPDKALLYSELGESYYLFKDYQRAIPYFREAIAVPEPKGVPGMGVAHSIHNSSRNTIGLCYLAINEPDSAAYWFQSILDSPTLTPIWEAIAKANTGKLLHMQGKDNEALPLLKSGMDKVIEIDRDYGFAAGCAVVLADIYVRRKDLTNGKHYIELSNQYIEHTRQTGRLRQLYPVLSRYYSYTGHPDKATEILDSVLSSQAAYSREFNNLTLLRVEQKDFMAQQQAAEEQLAIEKLKKENYRWQLLISIFSLILLSTLLFVVYYLYRKKKKAYRKLALRIQQWAMTLSAESPPIFLPSPETIDTDYLEETGELPEEETYCKQPGNGDTELFRKLHRLLAEENWFRNPDITLDTIATHMKINRNYLSQAVNRCTGKNFNTLVNEYRIKEAVRIMSQQNAAMPTIESIAFDSGFNDRKSFYRVFKKVTGLSPSEFRDSLQKE